MTTDSQTDNNEDQRPGLIAALAPNSVNTHLALAWPQTGGRHRVMRADIASDLSKKFLDQARDAAASVVARALIGYDPEWPLRDHEYFELADSDLQADDLLASLQDFSNLQRLTKKNLTKPKFYVVCVQTDDGVALFGRKMAELKVLKQETKSVFTAFWDGDSFNTLKESVATFATTFDWIFWHGLIYVLDSAGFHRVFRDNKELLAAVSGHVEDITSRIGVKNADVFRERCSRNLAMASKLKRISEHGLHLSHTAAELRSYATKYELSAKWDGDELVFEDTLSGQWEILKLLDEDRTEGPLSHRRYESAAKREV